jgi:hypothetical protein
MYGRKSSYPVGLLTMNCTPLGMSTEIMWTYDRERQQNVWKAQFTPRRLLSSHSVRKRRAVLEGTLNLRYYQRAVLHEHFYDKIEDSVYVARQWDDIDRVMRPPNRVSRSTVLKISAARMFPHCIDVVCYFHNSLGLHEVTGGWRKLHNEELHNLYSS